MRAGKDEKERANQEKRLLETDTVDLLLRRERTRMDWSGLALLLLTPSCCTGLTCQTTESQSELELREGDQFRLDVFTSH